MDSLESIPGLTKSLKIPSRVIFPFSAENQKDGKLAPAGRRRKHVCIFILRLDTKTRTNMEKTKACFLPAKQYICMYVGRLPLH
jgi:hypothetical protein